MAVETHVAMAEACISVLRDSTRPAQNGGCARPHLGPRAPLLGLIRPEALRLRRLLQFGGCWGLVAPSAHVTRWLHFCL